MAQFNERGEHIALEYAQIELGPMRPATNSAGLLPFWAYIDHDDIPYTTEADHRNVIGQIIPQGTKMTARRCNGVVVLSSDAHLCSVVLDGKRWLIRGAPTIDLDKCPELILCA